MSIDEECALLNLPPFKAPAMVNVPILFLNPLIRRECELARLRMERGLTENERKELGELLEQIAREEAAEAKQFPKGRINIHGE